MKRKRVITACIYSNAIHNEQILCAARVWAERNDHELVIQHNPLTDPYYITAVKFVVNDKYILVDNSDSPVLLNLVDKIDIYYKRSFTNKTEAITYPCPILPIGFNYGLSYKSFSWQRVHSFAEDKIYFARSFPLINQFVNLSYRHIDYRKMFDYPCDNGGNVLLLTRLWDPSKVSSPDKKKFREHLNTVRITSVRQLKQKFNQRLTAGIADTPLARQLCPDLIVDNKLSSKKNYLRLLKHSDICIATNGLENTLGWRIGEYVAFSKAVITEPFDVVVPGWEEEKHYYTFGTDDLSSKIDALLYNKAYVKMQKHNHDYYNTHLEPEALFNRLISGIIR